MFLILYAYELSSVLCFVMSFNYDIFHQGIILYEKGLRNQLSLRDAVYSLEVVLPRKPIPSNVYSNTCNIIHLHFSDKGSLTCTQHCLPKFKQFCYLTGDSNYFFALITVLISDKDVMTVICLCCQTTVNRILSNYTFSHFKAD